jgi:hypothetical protein
MVLGRFCKEVVFAGLAAEAQRPMLMADETKPPPAVRAAILQLGFADHVVLLFDGDVFLTSARDTGRRARGMQTSQLFEKCCEFVQPRDRRTASMHNLVGFREPR